MSESAKTGRVFTFGSRSGPHEHAALSGRTGQPTGQRDQRRTWSLGSTYEPRSDRGAVRADWSDAPPPTEASTAGGPTTSAPDSIDLEGGNKRKPGGRPHQSARRDRERPPAAHHLTQRGHPRQPSPARMARPGAALVETVPGAKAVGHVEVDRRQLDPRRGRAPPRLRRWSGAPSLRRHFGRGSRLTTLRAGEAADPGARAAPANHDGDEAGERGHQPVDDWSPHRGLPRAP